MKELIKARIALTQEQPFLGRLCLLLQLKEDPGCFTAATDGDILYYNPKFIEGLTERQVMGVLVHETAHAALGHIWRRGQREIHRFNFACDYAVNIIVRDNGYDLPQGVLYDEKYRPFNAEQIYEKLPPTKTVCVICSQGDKEQKGGGGGDGESKDSPDGKGDKEGKGSGKAKDRKGGDGSGGTDGGKLSSEEKTCHSHHYWAKAEKKKDRKQTQKKWEGAVAENAKLKGNIPAGFERVVEEARAKEDWRQILAAYLSSSMSDFDFMKRDRRSLNSSFYLPDLSSEDELENIFVAIDTSGSIGPGALNQFVGEVKSLLKTFPKAKGWLIDCDTAVSSFVDIEKAATKQYYLGGGGTSHVPVFEAIDKRKIPPKVVICFTDLYTDFPDKKPNYPVLWLVPRDGSSQPPPFGRVIRLK